MPILTTIPQCQHIKDDGIRCGSPALRGKDLCYFHQRQARRLPAFYIPPLTDRASIHVVLMEVMRGAFAGRMDDERLRTLLYALQVAISNLPHRGLGVPPLSRVARPGRVDPARVGTGALARAGEPHLPGRGRPGYTSEPDHTRAGESPASTRKEASLTTDH